MRRLFVLAAVVTLASSAWASHAGQYARNPVEHDDQGRSDEPDFSTTTVLGPSLTNRVLDLDRDGVATADPDLPPPHGPYTTLAPGCTDDSGRQLSGLCGVYTVGVGVVEGGDVVPPEVFGMQGTPHLPPPGGWTPTRTTVVRFLDARQDLQTTTGALGVVRADVNHKVADLSEPRLLPPFVAGPTGLWAWVGDWQDKNANGVIDHLGDGEGAIHPKNEFVWRGGCWTFSPPQVNPGPHCVVDPGAPALLAYVYPGDHTGRCGLPILSLPAACEVGGDLPAMSARCGLPPLPLLGSFATCHPDEAQGDPLLGPQQEVTPDGAFGDRTGDPDIAVRGWYYDRGWTTWSYDTSVVVGHVIVAAYGAPEDPAHPNRARLEQSKFLDVDSYRALNPDLEEVVQSKVKPSARAAYLLVRDVVTPLAMALAEDVTGDLVQNTGRADDLLWDPGWSHEPNTPGDLFPGARFLAFPPPLGDVGDATHHGWRNDYRAHRLAPRPWLDLQSYREAWEHRVLVVGNVHPLAARGSTMTLDGSPEPMQGHHVPRAEGDHARSLGPGIHHFLGMVGLWHDLPQVEVVQRFDLLTFAPVTTTYTVGPDTWVGDVLRTTGTDDEGFVAGPSECTIGDLTPPYPWGWCHPYLDGALADPQDYDATDEWRGACGSAGATSWPRPRVVVEPEGGTWIVPVFVWRHHFVIDVFDPPQLEDWTGRGTLTLQLHCYDTGDVLGLEALVLPLGNAYQRVTTTFEATLAGERVRDVDVYEPLGL